MAIIQIQKLMLVDAEDIELKNGVKKVKYTFINGQGQQVVAYDPSQEIGGEYKDEVVDWNGNLADIKLSEYRFTPKEYQGKVSQKLMPRNEKKAASGKR